VAAVVLAAGKGKRMKSAKPKVLHEVCGRPSLWYVLRAAARARSISRLVVVVSHGKEEVIEAVRSWNLRPEPVFVDQGEPLGTGHAVRVAEEATVGCSDVVVLAGDDPLITTDHVRELLRVHRRTRAAATVLTTQVENPAGYARVVREGNRLLDLVGEDVADADRSIRDVREVATLVYALRREDLFASLPLLTTHKRQREYYLFDVLAILREKGQRVSAAPVDLGGGMGLNSRTGLAAVARIMRRRILDAHMRNGVTVVDPDTTYVDVDVRIGPDTVLRPMTLLEGATRVGAGCSVGPGTRITDSTVGDGADVSFAVVSGSWIGPRASVGPYASIRPGTVIEERGKAGTFVELKATRVGRGAKVPHLSYMGDAKIGDQANIGAGSITCNYDGFEKHRTEVGAEAFIGSDTMLVAPVKVGRRAVTGAGSVVTRDVPEGALAVERSEQRIVEGYADRRRARHTARPEGGGSTGTARGTEGGVMEHGRPTRGGGRRA
jgi:bifunctional UDP-N-acetylglucosamine pyrophosphorylase/glucosamine-1-phosphate N-acetyltransferase